MYKVTGYRKVEYTNKNGKEVKGIELYVVCDEERNGLTGFMTDKLWLGSKIAYSPAVNDQIRVYFNRYGSVDEVVKA